MKETTFLNEIYIYPVKSLSGIKLDKAFVTKYGLAHPDNLEVIDRKWMVIDEKGSFRTQRQLPKMALIKPSVEGDNLILNAPGKNPINIPINKKLDTKLNCRVWNTHIDAYVYGGEISVWLSDFLGTNGLDLAVFANDLDPRKCVDLEKVCTARQNDVVIYEDFSPYMLISENSLNHLNEKLTNKVSIRQFRPNFFVSGCAAFEEDNWVNFQIGEAKFCMIKHCTRCLLTTVDPDKGEKAPDQQPLKTLKEFRLNEKLYGVSPMFGINLGIDNPGVYVSVGDKITLN